MNYIYYLLGVLLIGFLILQAVRFVTRQKYSRALYEYDKRHRHQAAIIKQACNNSLKVQPVRHTAGSHRGSGTALKRDMQRVSTPWGWPGHQKINGSGAGPKSFHGRLRAFFHHLTREKELVSNHSNNPRISNSFRALLQDRYGPVGRDSMRSIEYTKVKRRMLQDPGEPYDQMDNFGTRETQLVRSNLNRARAKNSGQDSAAADAVFYYVDPREIKQPWGW